VAITKRTTASSLGFFLNGKRKNNITGQLRAIHINGSRKKTKELPDMEKTPLHILTGHETAVITQLSCNFDGRFTFTFTSMQSLG
ncbi:hypothetical protein ACJX0J_021949, partial [Zea mays]